MAQNGEFIEENEFMKILASLGVEFLNSSCGKVHRNKLAGKILCLYFSANWCKPCKTFTPQLLHLYNSLKNNGKKLEIILISSDRDENAYKEHYKDMPWLTVPYDLNIYRQLAEQFNVKQIPALIPLSLDGNGKSSEDDCVSLVEDYGSDAYPFTKGRRDELKALDERQRRGGEIEELLAHKGRNYLISRDGKKIRVSELKGKTVGLYFGAHWCPPSRTFTAQLVDCYTELVTTLNQPFEVVFASADRDKDESIHTLSTMPWLAVPYDDKTTHDLKRIFDITRIPSLVVIGPDGKTVTANGRDMVSLYGAMAFPFTKERISEIEAALRKDGERLPDQVQDPRHVHELKLDMAKVYVCDACKKRGRFWAFSCDVCDYDLHPTCVEDGFQAC
ncbi:hypothetical protein RND81_10G177200 [Saponaria officinalis]|uniref:protein-disulfide reductase n=1 Tax=Saponaria officinalis TaxID=3572 RepID=A0AAW1I3Z1_SAPOF